jgi:predicted nuclease with TOPRIM domain
MSNSSQQHLYNATNRLVAALERLELGLQQVTVGRERDVQQHQHLLSYQRENEALLEEQEKMQTTIMNLQQQYEELQGVASTIYGKLDTSIERLTQILDK